MLKRFLLVMVLILTILALNVFVIGVQAQAVEQSPLIEPGPYGVGRTLLTFIDESREDWELQTLIWYPAVKPAGSTATNTVEVMNNAPPDRGSEPYPLILYSHGWQGNFGEFVDVTVHLASHGYVVAAGFHHDTDPVKYEIVNRPLDIMLILDELATIDNGDLAEMMDMDNVGLMGYSLGAQTSLQMLGLYTNPTHFEDWCVNHPDITTWDCISLPPLEETKAYRTQLGLADLPDGQWQPFGDERIQAVLAIAPGNFAFTTEEALAAVTTPTMILHGTDDPYADYEGNAVRNYNHLGTEYRYLVTLVGGRHNSFHRSTQLPQHFATAFFGYYLQSNDEFASYLSAAQAENWPDVVWGPYEGE